MKEKFQIDWFEYMVHGLWLQIHKSFQIYHHSKVKRIQMMKVYVYHCFCLSLLFVQIHFPIQLNVWIFFTSDFKDTIFHTYLYIAQFCSVL